MAFVERMALDSDLNTNDFISPPLTLPVESKLALLFPSVEKPEEIFTPIANDPTEKNNNVSTPSTANTSSIGSGQQRLSFSQPNEFQGNDSTTVNDTTPKRRESNSGRIHENHDKRPSLTALNPITPKKHFRVLSIESWSFPCISQTPMVSI